MNSFRNRLNAAAVAVAVVLSCVSLLKGGETIRITKEKPGLVELRLDKKPSARSKIEWEAREPEELETLGPYESQTVYVFNAPKPGRYIVSCDYVDFEIDDFEKTKFIVTVGQAPQPPPGPDPVEPDVTPPPTPTDIVTPAPIPQPGLRVLMVYESLDAPPKVPKAQYDAMFDGNVRDWLTGNCAVGPKNVAEWRMIDKDDLFVGEEQPHWKTAAMRPRRSLPWVLISNGTTNRGYEGPIPADSDKFLELLKRFK